MKFLLPLRFKPCRPVALAGRFVKSAQYNPRNRQLIVWRKGSGRSVHQGVPEHIYDLLVESTDPNWYYETYILDDRKAKSPIVKWLIINTLILGIVALIHLENM